MYLQTLKESFNDLKKNLILYIPHIVTYFILGLLFYGVLSLFGIDFLGLNEKLQDLTSEEASKVLEGIFKTREFFIAVAIFALLAFFISMFNYTLSYSMMWNAIRNKKLNFKDSLNDAKKKYWKFIVLGILLILLMLITSLILVLIVILLSLLSGGFGIILFLGFLIVLLFFYITLQFSPQYLFMDKLKSFEALKNSFAFVCKNKKLGIIVFLISLLFYVLAGILTFILNLAGFSLGSAIYTHIISFINLLINVTVIMLVELFKFRILKQLSNKRQKS